MFRRLRQAYGIAAFLAVVHVMLAIGAVAWLAGSGRLSVDQFKTIVQIVRGEMPQAAMDAPAAQAAATQPALAATGPVPGSDEEEIRRRHLERLRTQAQHQLLLANRQMVEVNRRREEFEQQVAQQQQADQERGEEIAVEGFEKDLELLQQVKPKTAVDRLLTRPVEDAARLLLAMDTRKSAKIIEAARKEPAKWAQMMAVLDRLRELSPATELDGSATASAP